MLNHTEIEARARRCLISARAVDLPISVEHVASHLGIAIEKADLGKDCSGVLIRQRSRAVIGVNRTDFLSRQRFTIAHEIGHFVLHKQLTYVDAEYAVNFRDLESGSGTKTEEVEANRFAAALLMPESSVKNEFDARRFDLAGDDDELRLLAQKFGVSAQAMAIRLSFVLRGQVE
jgi:Zn-dependent peptidase ImmA (M78 family)